MGLPHQGRHRKGKACRAREAGELVEVLWKTGQQGTWGGTLRL